jgi:hypothetical protein
MIKNKILWAGVLICTIVATGCKKVLDTSPFSSITDASAFATPERALLALYGIYDAAQGGPYLTSTENRGYPFGSANIQQGDMRGEDMVNIQAFYQITYQGTYNPTTANNVGLFQGLYFLINLTNVGIAGFTNAGTSGTISAPIAKQFEGEARFLRAMAHHEALIHFARPYADNAGKSIGVPWRDFPISSSAAVGQIANTPRMRVDSVYNNILADLDFAEANIPATIAVGTADVNYRATKGAVIALKMRVKLHMGDWAGVVAEGNKLVPATIDPLNPTNIISPIGGWRLTANPDGPFADNASKEGVFSIKNDPVDAPSQNAQLPGQYGAANLGGRGLVAISPVIWNQSQWQCDDKRRSLLTVTGTNSAGSQSIFTSKYRQYSTRSDWAPQIRYAEVLLNLAEAEARQSATVSTRALNLLNAVRNRSLATPATQQYTAASFANKNALITAILFERRVEFLAEGKRWGDIHRLAVDPVFSPGGIPAKAANGTAGLTVYNCGAGYTPGQAAIPYSDYRFLFPIPQAETSQNPIVAQNPGY